MEVAHFSLLLALLLSVFAADGVLAEFWNIDCGASAGYTEASTNLTWVTDSGYVRGGESHLLPPNNTVGFSRLFWTLRAFPGKTRKNCYTIPVEANTNIRVRVGFYYGNYDGLANPPSFRLMFDTTDWTTVKTEMDRWRAHELIYRTSRNHTDICVWRLVDDEVPFVSYILVRTLDPLMYNIGGLLTSNFSLYAPWRYSFGLNQTVRYPDDSYDRSWFPMNTNSTSISDYKIVERSGGVVVNTSTSVDNPPAKLFARAISAKAPSQNLTIGTDFVSSMSPMYFNLYFSEIKPSLNRTEKRAFRIYIDDQEPSNNAGILTPPLGSVLEFSTFVLRVTGSTRITLAPTADSTLPPIVSGFEALYIWKFSKLWTYDSDAVALSSLQDNIPSLQNWTGDPCLPATYNWEWVACSLEEIPRITKLYLGGLGLSGDIPDFSKLDALVFIDLQNNNLSGSVPEFLASFPKLTALNLADNDFSSVPSVFTKNNLIVNVTGNPRLCSEDKICIYSPNSRPPPPPQSMNAPPPPNGRNGAPAQSFFSQSVVLLGISLMLFM